MQLVKQDEKLFESLDMKVRIEEEIKASIEKMKNDPDKNEGKRTDGIDDIILKLKKQK